MTSRCLLWILVRSYHRHITRGPYRSWEIRNLGQQTLESLIITGSFNSYLFTINKLLRTTSVQDLDPRPSANNDHVSVLAHEMTTIEPGEKPSRTLTWKPLVFLSHIKCRTNDDRFSDSQWEFFFFSILGVPTPGLIGPPQQCICNTLGIICRLVNRRQWILRFTIGLVVSTVKGMKVIGSVWFK